MDFREGRLWSRLVHWRKSRFLRKQKVECNAHEQQPNSEPVESHTYFISLRYIFTYKIFSRGFQVVASVEICQPKSCKSVRICHVPDVASLRSSSLIYLQFRFRVQIMDFILSFAPFSCLFVCFFFFKSEYSPQLLCVKALPIDVLPSRDQISHPYRQKQHVS